MSIEIIQNRMSEYKCATVQEEEYALREITQEVILAGLSRTDFFKYAEFHGGTALRICHGTTRFSEDLDFMLTEPGRNFCLNTYLSAAAKELTAYGYVFEIVDRSRAEQAVKKAFLKDDSVGKLLELRYLQVDRSMKKIRIKVEVDTNPPKGSTCETQYLTFPFPASITVHDRGSLFAGKLHALLCRKYIKGRDWYDLIWYSTQKVAINYQLLTSALYQNGPWAGQDIEVSCAWCRNALLDKVQQIDWRAARQEVEPFVREYERASLDVWGTDFFTHLVEKTIQ